MQPQEWLDFCIRVERQREKISKAEVQLKKLLNACSHSERVPKSCYFEGNYNDWARTEYWDECVVCGHKINHRDKEHGWFG